MSRRKQANPNRVSVGAGDDEAKITENVTMVMESTGGDVMMDSALNIDTNKDARIQEHLRKLASPKKAVAAVNIAHGGESKVSAGGDGGKKKTVSVSDLMSSDVESQGLPEDGRYEVWDANSESNCSMQNSFGNSYSGSEGSQFGLDSSQDETALVTMETSNAFNNSQEPFNANTPMGKGFRKKKARHNDDDAQLEDSDEDWDVTKIRKRRKGYSGNRYGKRRKKSKPPAPGEIDESDKGMFTCQICHKVTESAHEFTLHIRKHNAMDCHNCKICSKKLSSASSLDRHMLVHSGERPFKCKICRQAFTTNGNMYRHMRIHEKDSKMNSVTIANDYSVPRLKLKSKRRRLMEIPPSPPKVKLEPMDGEIKPETDKEMKDIDSKEELSCPICSKTFLCKYGLQTHQEMHPTIAQRCTICDCAFKTPRGLRMHILMAHKSRKTGVQPSGPAHIPVGFQDLGFAEFSSTKFPLIAKSWCEKHVRRCSSSLHQHVCRTCNKAFPCVSALNLHVSSHGTIKADTSDDGEGNKKILSQHDFMSALKLNPHKKLDETIENKDPAIKSNQYIIIIRKPATANGNGTTYQAAVPATIVKTEVPPRSTVKLNMVKSPVSIAPKPRMENENDFADVQQILKVTSSSSNPMYPTQSAATTVMSNSTNRPMPPLRRMPQQPIMPRPIVCNVPPPPPPPLKCGQLNNIHIKQEIHHQPELLSPLIMTPENMMAQSVTPEDLRLHSSDGDESDDIITFDTNIKKSLKKTKKYACKYCKEVFPLSRALKSHIRSHFGLTPYKCSMCNYSSADKSTLIRHMRTHNGERPFMCQICEFAFTTKANCERHVKKKHNKATKAEIDVCISYNHYLADSSESTETFRSPDTICKYCNKDFKFFRALRHHLRSHSSCREKPFHCKICDNGFSTKNNCIRHILKRHANLSQVEVEAAVMFHAPLKWTNIASELEKSASESDSGTIVKEEFGEAVDFSIKYGSTADFSEDDMVESNGVDPEPMDLSVTKKANTGDNDEINSGVEDARKFRFRPIYHRYFNAESDALDCPHCNLQFNKGCLFKEHLRTHSSERPFRCYHCSAAFTLKENLEKHMEKRHQEVNKQDHKTFLPTIIYPAQHKLLTKAAKLAPKATSRSQNRVQESPVKAVPVTTIFKKNSRKRSTTHKSPSNSMGSDSSGDLASVSRMLAAATNCNNFETFLKSKAVVECKEEDEDGDDEGAMVIDDKSMSEPTTHTKSRVSAKLRRNSFPSINQKLSCPYCPRTFPWISSLRRHILTHTGVKPFRCPQCGVYFSTKSNCERHMLRKHCNNNAADINFRRLTERPFKCHMCMSSSFSTRQRLRRHYMMKHPGASIPEYEGIEDIQPEEAPVIISGTDFVNFENNGLDDSLKETDFVALSQELSKTNSEVMAKAVPANEDSLQCNEVLDESQDNEDVNETPADVSKTTFIKVASQETKRKTGAAEINKCTEIINDAEDEDEDDDEDDLNSSNASSSSSPKKRGRRASERIACDICSKQFKYATTLTRHMRIHTLAHPFKCTDCNARFTTKFNCQRHIMKIHSKNKEDVLYIHETLSDEDSNEKAVSNTATPVVSADPVVEMEPNEPDVQSNTLSFVEVKFDNKGNSCKIPENYHQRKKKCEICQKRFWSKQELQRHLRTHSHEKPFACEQCDRSFSLKHSLMRHMRVHQDENDEKDSKTKANTSVEEPSEEDAAQTHKRLRRKRKPLEKNETTGKEATQGASHSSVEGLDPGVVVVNPEAPPASPKCCEKKMPWGANDTIEADSEVYMTSAEDDRSMLMKESSEPDMFTPGDEVIASCMDNSDIIQNLLGIHDSSVIDQMLDSADSAASAAKLLGME
ncbi:ras-responsive element-binding protein 1 isoform X2 [Saccoglossus kowalevskii]|uniref:Ras-responsive element-binding protein 1 n=2 Tax=Saccoglossus kowalevskii TaxID=10224 RepID=A0ABM0H0U3_SACKO|nr:PREDICTED: ras-responsive element-binding protein 1 [Saccoglossus kowalevskii]